MSTILVAPTLEEAQATVKRTSEAQAAQLNAMLQSAYLNQFYGWCISVNAGRIPNTDPPQPPKSYVVVSLRNDGWFFPEPIGPAVCEIPPLPPDVSKKNLPPGVIDIGGSADNGAGVWFGVGPNDTWFAAGKRTPTMPDGHVYECVVGIGGKGWYERVA